MKYKQISRIPVTKVVDFSQQVPFNIACTICEHQLVGDITLTPIQGPGYSSEYYPALYSKAIYRIIGDGTSSVTFAAPLKQSSVSEPFSNNSGVVNLIQFLFDGADYWYTISYNIVDHPTTTVVPTTAPVIDIPTDFTATVISDTAIDLNCTTTEALSYEISTNGTDFTEVGTTVKGTTILHVTEGLTAGTLYYFRVRAYLGAVFSAYSGVVSATSDPVIDYFVSNEGDDDNTGLSRDQSWATLSKINTGNFAAGTVIGFKKGAIFYGTLEPPTSGTVGDPIVFTAYGSGDKPIISGFTTISGWTDEGGGIYSKVITSEAQTNMVTVDGVNTGMGRFPNAGTDLIIDSHSTNVSITDADLDSTVTDWTGAEVVIRKNEYIMDRCMITNHTDHTLTYTDANNSSDATDGYYFFIQNDIRCLSSIGDWYHDTNTGKFYMYFGETDPTTKAVKVATLNYIVHNDLWEGSYLKFDGLTLEGSINNTFHQDMWYTPYNTIINCNIQFSGGSGVYSNASNTSVLNTTIHDCIITGVWVERTNSIISDNVIYNIGIIEGQAPLATRCIGILSWGDDNLIHFNNVYNIGYNGIKINDNDVLVTENVVSNFCLVLNDGGGIYASGSSETGRRIERNKIYNGVGKQGIQSMPLSVHGIYLDDLTNYITVNLNIVYDCNGAGLFLHSSSHITGYNNTLYNNLYQLLISNTTGSAINYLHAIKNNILFTDREGAKTFRFSSPIADDVANLGVIDNNLYFNSVDNTALIEIEDSNFNASKTFAQWKTYSGQDANSLNSDPIFVSTYDFHLQNNSPAINTGIDVGILEDYEGNSLVGLPDIGAYEKQ
jgi:parallel beta-helix repeat protein